MRSIHIGGGDPAKVGNYNSYELELFQSSSSANMKGGCEVTMLTPLIQLRLLGSREEAPRGHAPHP